jgi:hypothetical protein
MFKRLKQSALHISKTSGTQYNVPEANFGDSKANNEQGLFRFTKPRQLASSLRFLTVAKFSLQTTLKIA